jgi:hypothetical protein
MFIRACAFPAETTTNAASIVKAILIFAVNAIQGSFCIASAAEKLARSAIPILAIQESVNLATRTALNAMGP